MRRLCLVAALALSVLLQVPPSVGAAEKKHVTKYKGEVHEGDTHKKVTFDFQKKGDREKLLHHLDEGTLAELAQDTGTPNLLRLPLDLGLWAIVVFVG